VSAYLNQAGSIAAIDGGEDVEKGFIVTLISSR
jgi:hypothetical protein